MSRHALSRLPVVRQYPQIQRGVMLLEALIGILIFSIGILAIIGLQGTAISYTTDSKYRTDAGLLANQLVARMWTETQSVKNSPGVRDLFDLQNQFQGGKGANGTNGAQYDLWVKDVANTLPGVAANMPDVFVNTANGEVRIYIYWMPPNQQGQVRTYITVAYIS